MPSIIKRSITINGHRTSFSLEDIFYDALMDIVRERDISLAELIAQIDEENSREIGANKGGLSSAIRIYVFKHVQNKARSNA